MAETVKKRALDFTNVKESSGINPVRVEAGDYLSKIIKVEETMKDETPMWNFIFQLDDRKSATYPYYCKLQENQLWKVRNLLTAVGKVVPKKRVNVDPNSLVGKAVGITLEDDEYEGKLKSVIVATFPPSEFHGSPGEDDQDVSDVDDADGEAAEDEGDLDLDDL